MSYEVLSTTLIQNNFNKINDKVFQPYHYPRQELVLSDFLRSEISKKNLSGQVSKQDRLSRLGGGLAFHCRISLKDRAVTEAASMATLFRGYEALLPGRDLNQVGRVSSTASGLCGGVHATASAMCLEMALDLQPPPLGIVMRNLLLSCQYLNDNPMHLFILSGPDYSQAIVQATNSDLWAAAQRAAASNVALHGYHSIADIMKALNKPDGKLYQQALQMVRLAREAYSILGGQYPHSESIVPGGVNVTPSLDMLDRFINKLQPFYDYAKQSIGLWDDIYDFMLAFNPRYYELGKMPATMVDFGQWDHENFYDGCYANCDSWGEKRWSTPAAIISGKLITNRLSDINVGLEEFVDHSYYEACHDYSVKTDPLGKPLSPYHPWNKKVRVCEDLSCMSGRYSWGTSITWDRQVFEVGAYARMYATALSKKIPHSDFIESTGQSLRLEIPKCDLPAMLAEWRIPMVWNAFERNRARAYAVAFNLMVTVENYHRAKSLLQQGEKQTSVCLSSSAKQQAGERLGVGFWGAGRGLLAHWGILKNNVIDNYQICVPSRINAAPRTPWGALGACEQAVLNTPIIENNFTSENDFQGIDIQRCLQSFDPCMKCEMHMAFDDKALMLNREIDTCFPI